MKPLEMQIGFSMEPADRSVGIMAEGFAAWLIGGSCWCNLADIGHGVGDVEDATFEWFDNDDGEKCARPIYAEFVEAALVAWARTYYAERAEAMEATMPSEGGES
jgi:hypothetical protein